MICPECKKQGLKSKVYPHGSVSLYGDPHPLGSRIPGSYDPSQPYMGLIRFYDEEGKYHCHDTNPITLLHTCSNGHTWNETRHAYCPACGLEWLEGEEKGEEG